MNIKTIVLEAFVNFVDSTKKQNTYKTRIKNLFMIILSLLLIFLLFKYLNE